jgi:hypothetical protein
VRYPAAPAAPRYWGLARMAVPGPARRAMWPSCERCAGEAPLGLTARILRAHGDHSLQAQTAAIRGGPARGGLDAAG